MSAEPTPVGSGLARKLLVDAVVLLVSRDLVARNVSDWRLDWTGRSGVPAAETWGQSGTQKEFRDVVSAAVDRPEEVARLRLHLAELGVDPEGPTAPQTSSSAASGTMTPRGVNANAVADADALAPKVRARRDRMVAGIATLIGCVVVIGVVVALGGTSASSGTPPPFVNPAIVRSPAVEYPTYYHIVIPTDILQSFVTSSPSGHGQ